jgi:hypothetical protein
MTLKEIAYQRLALQQISHPQFDDPEDVVRWLGVVQAQDYLAALWAIASRAKNLTEENIEKALADKKIVRTWPLRGTLHFVAAEDVRWILENFAPRITALHKARLKRDSGIDEKVVTRSKKVLERVLLDGKQLTRDEVYEALDKAKIVTKDQRGLHILWRLAHDGLICFGPRTGKQHTFTLLDEWIPSAKKISREEALTKLATRYFQSHSPATVQDFAWWSGLPNAEAKVAIEMIKPKLITEKIGSLQYFMPADLPLIKKASSVHLLPGYDEFLISYTNRTASLATPDKGKMINTINGIFFPTVVVNGKVEGTWKRDLKKDSVLLTTKSFNGFTVAQKKDIAKAAKRYGKFLGKKVEVVVK